MSANLPHSAKTGVSPFQVVPPAQIKPRPAGPSPAAVPPPEPPSPTTEAAPSDRAPHEDSTAKADSHRRWRIVAIALASLGAISLIPTPYEVGGTVQLTWKQSARQSVHTPVPAMVSEILVETGEVVQPGQVLAQLSSPQLAREIAEVEEKLARAIQEREAAQREAVRANATVLEAAARAEAAEMRANRMQERLSQLQQGVLTPEVQGLVIERDRLEGQIEEVAVQVQRYEALYQQGAVALATLESYQIQQRKLERDLAAKAEQIRLAQRQLVDVTRDEVAVAATQDTSVVAAQQVAAAQVTAQTQTIETLSRRLEELRSLRETLTLRATTSGTVITSDLDLRVGQELRPDTALMQIAELGSLTANVEIPEEDLDYVEMNAPVTFRPRQAKLETYTARVEDILYNVEPDKTEQRRVATVRLIIDNPDNRLRPGSSGYARIFSEWIPLYERAGREILKLIPERFL